MIERLSALLVVLSISVVLPDGATAAGTARVDAGSRATEAAASMTAEKELEVVRRALISAVQDAPTRVISTAWIDGDGALQERAYFKSAATVRGVRVLSYLERGAGEQVAGNSVPRRLSNRLRAALNDREQGREEGRERGRIPEDCDPGGSWRQAVSATVHGGPAMGSDARRTQMALAREVQRWWFVDAGTSDSWYPTGAATAPLFELAERPVMPTGSAYRQVLTGTESRHLGWLLTIGIAATPGGSREADWRIDLALWRVGESTPRHSASVSLPAAAASEAFVGQSAILALRAELQRWHHQIDRLVACEPVLFEARLDASTGWTLTAGFDSGLRVGQRILILDRQRGPTRWAEPDAVPVLVMAEVQRVTGSRAELRQLAGPRLPAEGDWVAVPM